MTSETSSLSLYERDLREWNIPEDVLRILLKDRTTGKNIIWATDDYASRGNGFGFFDEIKVEQITDRDNPVIRPRVDKCKDEQRMRVVKRAEVFTPAWVCNAMINMGDNAWFGRKTSPFNVEGCHQWKTITKPVHFPKGKTWQQYVRECRLEITCGEAPFLASRYDAVTGEMIPVPDRIGILDRKLRVVTENIGVQDRQDWLYHAKRAVQGTYGFEWQGDNIVLARENILATVVENFNFVFFDEQSTSLDHILGGQKTTGDSETPEHRGEASPGMRYLMELAEIISWNIWQMDGLKFVVPMSCKPIEERDMFGNVTFKECEGCKKRRKDIRGSAPLHTGTYCRIMHNWDRRETVHFYRYIMKEDK